MSEQILRASGFSISPTFWRALRHAAPRAAGRGGHQDRDDPAAATWRASWAPCRAERASDGDQLPGAEREQEVGDPQHEVSRGQGDIQEAGEDGRRAGRELPARCHGSAGLGYDILKEINPGLIYCAISGFGQTGPDAHKPAYDQIIQGLSGEMAVNGDERLNPLRAGFPVCDTVGGLNGAFAIMAALYHRERTGKASSSTSRCSTPSCP